MTTENSTGPGPEKRDERANEAPPWLGATLNFVQEGIQVIGFDWRYLYLNDAVCRHGRKSREELLGRTMMEAYPGIEATPVFRALEECMKDRRARALENEFEYADGAKAWFELRIAPCPEGIFVLSVDVTERKDLELQLLQSQKMDAVGKLAGGVAHDFNNLLTAIRGFTQFALEAIPREHEAAADLQQVLEAAERSATLINKLLAFARRQQVRPRIIDPNQLVGSLESLLRRLIGADIDVVTRLAPDLWRTSIDPGAFEQVLVNLAVNARDAMPDGGRLTIETSNSTLDAAQGVRRGSDMAAGDYVVLAVSDDGIGMDEATQRRIFDPFFTTKDAGRGTGLGLSTCWGIVAQAGGYIWVYSEPGQGTTFKIYLRRAIGEAEPLDRPDVGPTAGTETILLVEDDDQVREVAVRALEREGYAVLVAAAGEEALAVAESRPDAIDLLVTDLVMPGLSGRELAERLHERYPRLRTLFVTGYTESAIAHRRLLAPGARILTKPFGPRMLARAVREALDEKP